MRVSYKLWAILLSDTNNLYVGTEWRFAPRWHLALELAYNDASTLRIGLNRRF